MLVPAVCQMLIFLISMLFCSLCSLRSDSSTARGGGREQVENSPVQAEGSPHHPHDNGGAVSEVCRWSGLQCAALQTNGHLHS